MSEILAVTSGAEGRYAKALFSIALEKNNLKKIESDLSNIKNLVSSSNIFEKFLHSPLYNSYQQQEVISKISKKLKLTKEVNNLIFLLCKNRRLSLLFDLIKSFEALSRIEKGEIHAEVVSFEKLSKEQEKKIEDIFKKNLGKQVILEIIVDKSIIGGLIFRIGSKMIDTSTKSKLFKLETLMKEVG